MRNKLIASVTLVTLLLLLAVSAQAASVAKLSLAELSLEARDVVIGTVTDVKSDWAQDRRQIYTTVTLQVSESLKGSAEGTITFRQLGGVVGDTRVSVAGFPKFVPGSEVLLFLSGDPAGVVPTVGLGQGKFDVTIDQQTGAKVVANDVLGLQTPAGKPLTATETMTMTLDEMKAAVAEALAPQQDLE